MYYYEPLNQTMNDGQVTALIGSVVLGWSEERQNELGLFKAYFTDLPAYGPYTQRVSGSSWVKNTSSENPYDGSTLPYYEQQWSVVSLTSAERVDLEPAAELVVATEIESRLLGINTWASARHVVNTSWPVPQSVKDYINALLALNTANGDYPNVLADSVVLGTYTGWPTRLNALEIQQLVDPT
jgi:hypothetical protein